MERGSKIAGDPNEAGAGRIFRKGVLRRRPGLRAYVRGDKVEVSLGRGFTQEDLNAVKSIPGRRWDVARLVWVLPHTPQSLDALADLFGERISVIGGSQPGGGEAVAAGGRMERGAGESGNAGTGSFDVLAAVSRELGTRDYSGKTAAAYLSWTRRFLKFQETRAGHVDPGKLTGSHASEFLEHLATRCLAPRSRNQAASALAFMFREVLGRDELAEVPRARGPKRVPLVLTHREVLRVLRELHGKYFLVAVLLYSAGLRLEECLRLRVKDVDFELRQILVRDGKGKKDRYVPLAERAIGLLRAQIRRVAERHAKDRAAGNGWAALPGALHRKDPEAGYELRWQYIFAASTINTDPATDRPGRWPLHATAVQREVKRAVDRSGITKRATCHTFRHSFATEALRGGCDIRTLQHVLGHKDIRTTMIYLHAVEQTGLYIRSPLDRPDDPEDLVEEDIGGPATGAEGLSWDLAARQWGRTRRPAE